MPQTVPLESAHTSAHHAPRWRGWVLGALAVAAALAVFALYTRPDFLVMLADQMWACF